MSNQPLTVRFPQPLRSQLTATAAAERRSVSNLVRLLVEDGLAARDRDAAADWLRHLGYRFKGDR